MALKRRRSRSRSAPRKKARTSRKNRFQRKSTRSRKRSVKTAAVRRLKAPTTTPKSGTVVRFVKPAVVGKENPVGVSGRLIGYDRLPSRWLNARSTRPRRVYTQHAYSDCDELTPGGELGVDGYEFGAQIRGNGIYDPKYGAGGHQPEGVDFMKSQYTHYKVHGSKVTMTIRGLEQNINRFAKFKIGLRANKIDDSLIDYKPQKFLSGTGMPLSTTIERLREMYATWPEKQALYRTSKFLYNAQAYEKQNMITLSDKVWTKDMFIRESSELVHSHDIPTARFSNVAVSLPDESTWLWEIGCWISCADSFNTYQTIRISYTVTYYVEWYNAESLYEDVLNVD